MVGGSSICCRGFSGGLLQFVSYILGMGSVTPLLTLGIALVKGGVVVGPSAVLPYVQKISAILLLLAGGYIVYYGFSSGLLL